MSKASRGLIPTLIGTFATRLRFPQLFMFTALLFVIDLIVPDLIPFMDEVLLGLVTLLLGMWKKEPSEIDVADDGEKPPIKDITPPSK